MQSNIKEFKRKRILIPLLPFIILLTLIIFWGVIGLLASMNGPINNDNSNGVISLLQTAVSRFIPLLIGICVIAIPSGIFGGIYYHRRLKQESWTEYDERSGKGGASEIPEEIKGWNWGAAFLGVFWGPYFGVWSGLLLLIPLFNLVYFFIFGFNASEKAWRSNRWKSVEQFKKTRRKWSIAGIIIVSVAILLKLLVLGGQ